MSAQVLLHELRVQGFDVRLGRNGVLVGPILELPEPDRERVRRYRESLVALLDEEEHPPGIADHEVTSWLWAMLADGPVSERELREATRWEEIPWAMVRRVAADLEDVRTGWTWSRDLKDLE